MDAELLKASWGVTGSCSKFWVELQLQKSHLPQCPFNCFILHRGKKINCCKPLQNKIYFRAQSDSKLHNGNTLELTLNMLQFIQCSRILPNTDFKNNVLTVLPSVNIIRSYIVSASVKCPHLVKRNCLLHHSSLIIVLKIKATWASKMMVTICQSARCHIPENCNLNTCCITWIYFPCILLLFWKHSFSQHISYEHTKFLKQCFPHRLSCLLTMVLIQRNVTPAFGKNQLYTHLSPPSTLMLTKWTHSS